MVRIIFKGLFLLTYIYISSSISENHLEQFYMRAFKSSSSQISPGIDPKIIMGDKTEPSEYFCIPDDAKKLNRKQKDLNCFYYNCYLLGKRTMRRKHVGTLAKKLNLETEQINTFLDFALHSGKRLPSDYLVTREKIINLDIT